MRGAGAGLDSNHAVQKNPWTLVPEGTVVTDRSDSASSSGYQTQPARLPAVTTRTIRPTPTLSTAASSCSGWSTVCARPGWPSLSDQVEAGALASRSRSRGAVPQCPFRCRTSTRSSAPARLQSCNGASLAPLGCLEDKKSPDDDDFVLIILVAGDLNPRPLGYEPLGSEVCDNVYGHCQPPLPPVFPERPLIH